MFQSPIFVIKVVMSPSSTEDAIRRYMEYLQDPESIRDQDQITKLQKTVDTATDPVDKLTAMGALDQALAVDGSEVREAFIAVAKDWADTEGVPPDAFRQLGVPAADLAAAGFKTRGGRRTATGPAPGRSRARRVPLSDIKAALGSVPKRFHVKDLETVSGGTNATVRKAVAELVAEGTVTDLGPDPDWSGRGRSPVLYEKG